MARDVPRDAPWTAPQAAEWDCQTFETWKLANAHTAEARDLLDLGIEPVFAAEPRDVSLLHVLFYIATRRASFDNLINTAGGAQEDRIVGGSQRIAIEAREAARQAGAPQAAGAPDQAPRQAGRGPRTQTRPGREAGDHRARRRR